MATARIIVFSDFACPYSYVTEAALRRRSGAGDVEVDYRALELYPEPTRLPADPARSNEPELLVLAEREGVRLDRPGPPTRTRKAHEAARAAREHGLEDAMRAAIFSAYWAEGRDIGRIDVLVELGSSLGIDHSAMKVVLDIDRYADAVAAEGEAARRAGVDQVPTVVVTGRKRATPILRVGALSHAELDGIITGS